MLGLPNFGDRVRVWPFPGRQAQVSEYPVDALGGGRFIAKKGEEVIWSAFHLQQLMGGAILMHPPPCDEHDHGDRGDEECCHCGRDVKAAQQYDVDYAKGKQEAEAAAKAGHPEHPHERNDRLFADAEKRKKARDEAKEKAAVESAAKKPKAKPDPAAQ